MGLDVHPPGVCILPSSKLRAALLMHVAYLSGANLEGVQEFYPPPPRIDASQLNTKDVVKPFIQSLPHPRRVFL